MKDIAFHAGPTSGNHHDVGTTRNERASSRSPSTRWLTLFVALFLGATLIACDNPCENLHKKVCEDPAYLKANRRHCELMNEQARRDALPKDYCESILKSISRQ